MIWLHSAHETAPALPAAWLIATGARPGNLTERSQLRRETARQIIARQLALPLYEIEIGHDGSGRPLLARPTGRSLNVSLATRAGLVAVALAQPPVGIDIERVDLLAWPPLAALHPNESAMLRELPDAEQALAFARLWAAKEAYVKALGTGFIRAPESFAVSLHSSERFTVADPARPGVTAGVLRTIENGGQEILAAAMVMLD